MRSAAAPARHRAPSTLREVLPVVVASGLVAAAAVAGLPALVVVIVVVQVAAAAGVLMLADAPARRQSAILATVAAGVADVLVVRDDGRRVGDLVVVVSLSFVAAVVMELVRRDRVRVTESLAATVTAVLVVAMGAHAIALHGSPDGARLVVVAFLAVALGLLAAGAVELLVRGPLVASGARRGILGIASVTATAAVVGVVTADFLRVDVGIAVLLAVATAVAAEVGDLVVQLACADVPAARRRAVAGPLGAALPVIAAAPVAYAVSRLAIG